MRVLKKYANRRLYDTENSRYVTINDVHQLILDYQLVKIVDASSGEDITNQILLQIIINRENNKAHKQIFTRKLLEQLIRMYSYDNGTVLSDFLEHSLSLFADAGSKQQDVVDTWMNLGQKQFEIWQNAFQLSGATPDSAKSNDEDKAND